VSQEEERRTGKNGRISHELGVTNGERLVAVERGKKIPLGFWGGRMEK